MGYSIFARAEHKLYIIKNKIRLKNDSPSIISSNCNGSMILHDLDLKFNTPTVNLYFETSDFLKFVSDLDKYVHEELIEAESSFEFPVGRLGDIHLYFMHYPTFAEAKEKWEERVHRINTNNLFIMMTDKNGCTYEQMLEFDALPYKNKVIFTHKPYPEIQSSYYIKGFEDQDEVGVLSNWKPGFWKRRWLDDFDYVRFLNGKSID